MISPRELVEKTQPIVKKNEAIKAEEYNPYQMEQYISSLKPLFEETVSSVQRRLRYDQRRKEFHYNTASAATAEELDPVTSYLPEAIDQDNIVSIVSLLGLTLASVRPQEAQLNRQTTLSLVPELAETGRQLEAAARFCALVHVVEQQRTQGRHQPSWEQTETALYMIAHPKHGELQRIEMGTGEGKTFTIGMAALWRALRGEEVSVHTDKSSNVEQSYDKMRELYALFEIECQPALYPALTDPNTYQQYLLRRKEFLRFVSARRKGQEFTPRGRVRYGVWSQFVHESLQIKSLIAQLEHQVRGKTEAQRTAEGLFTPPRENIQQELEVQIEWLKMLLNADAIMADEGDHYVDLETNDAILTEPDNEGYSEEEQTRMRLVWDVLSLHQTQDSLDRIADALHQPREVIDEYYKVEQRRITEGEQLEGDSYVITDERTLVNFNRMYSASLLEVVTHPESAWKLLNDSIHSQEFSTSSMRSKSELKRFRKALRQSTEGEQIDWEMLTEALPSPTRSELQQFFSGDHVIFDYQHLGNTRVMEILRRGDGAVKPEELQELEEILSAELPDFRQLFTVSRLTAVIDQVWLGMFQRYGQSFIQAQELEEGNHYQQVKEKKTWPDGRVEEEIMIEVLGENREPQPGKQFSELIHVFLCLKHNIPLPKPSIVTASISPALWYQVKAVEGADVSSISGSQDDPDFVTESTGRGFTEILANRVLPDRETKLQEVVAYALQHRDRPILLCAQNIKEFNVLAESLTAQLPAEDLYILDAAHADQANQYVPQLEPGKIVLLQISARGQDFGRSFSTEDGERSHTFADGLIISASALNDPHLLVQLEGRLGGKRPDGQIVTFSSLEDGVMQQRYEYNAELRTQQEERFVELEKIYQQLVGMVPDVQWPPTASAAMAGLETALEASEDSYPDWVQNLLQSSQPSIQRLSRQLQDTYSKIIEVHAKAVEYQQELNLLEKYEQKQAKAVIDVTVQKVWQILLSPAEDTPLGQAVAHLSFEERRRLADQVFLEAPQYFPISTKDIQSNAITMGAQRSLDRTKHERFFVDLTNRIIQWVEMDSMNTEYQRLRHEHQKLQLPQSLEELQEWLESYVTYRLNGSFKSSQRAIIRGEKSQKALQNKVKIPSELLESLQVISQKYIKNTQKSWAKI